MENKSIEAARNHILSTYINIDEIREKDFISGWDSCLNEQILAVINGAARFKYEATDQLRRFYDKKLYEKCSESELKLIEECINKIRDIKV